MGREMSEDRGYYGHVADLMKAGLDAFAIGDTETAIASTCEALTMMRLRELRSKQLLSRTDRPAPASEGQE